MFLLIIARFVWLSLNTNVYEYMFVLWEVLWCGLYSCPQFSEKLAFSKADLTRCDTGPANFHCVQLQPGMLMRPRPDAMGPRPKENSEAEARYYEAEARD